VLRRALGVLLVVGMVVTAGGCGDEGEPETRTAPTSDQGPDPADTDLWLSFDSDTVGAEGESEYPDESGGGATGRVVTANGGGVEEVEAADGRGLAVAFPAACTDATGCPRAMVEVAADPSLDPGEAPFSYGASVWLSPDQTAAGSNIVQQGRFGSSGGQWKLQVDGEEGFPSCVVRSGPDVVTVRSTVSVADREWHRVVCRRSPDAVSIEVDGTVEEEAGETGSVTSELPIRIGSPGVADSDDQFHGSLDDVFLVIERP
jgi:hypothetical protein